jgi:hypothetical protein
MFVPGLAAALLRVALIPVLPIPEPHIHDEFSFLLGADTFFHGRLANPPHPYWRFFETIHELSIPAYASKYPPGQALFLAAGQVLFGHPFFGCILSLLFFVTAVVWMLRAWVPPGFALLGGMFTAIEFGTGHYWLDSYWGGAAAAGASALVLGAIGRIRRTGRFTAAWPLSVGVVLLWCTRPFEGAFFVVVIAALVAWDVAKHRVALAGARSFAAVLLVCGALTIAGQAYLDFRVTGSALTLPYMLHIREYSVAPMLWVQHLRTPTLETNAQVHQQQASEVKLYEERRAGIQGTLDWAEETGDLLNSSFPVGLGAVGVLSLLFWVDPAVRDLWVVLAVSAIPLALETWVHLHYMSTVAVTLIALLFRVLWLSRKLRWNQRRTGIVLSGFLLWTMFPVAILANGWNAWEEKHDPSPFEVARGRIGRQLLARDGMHVVFVRYSPAHDVEDEWVYNSADIDRQRLIWARDLGEERNMELIRYYAGRDFWILDADADPPRVSPYGLLSR